MDNTMQMFIRFKQGNIAKESFLGLVVTLMLSKEIFKNNSDVASYAKEVFNIHFLPYAVRSRTLMVAKLCRVIINYNEITVKKISIKTYQYINEHFVIEDENRIISSKNYKTNALDNMDKWIGGILKKK
ncbi:hypothetical protein [Serratia fonticola]|uniref:hypothetical protein n=1 Tax=Serratia fonticola TaxID=47917 RepID=UPI001376C52A|nr:hypothetical protein [Serratia fonticola]NBJ34431.1 hypothetical protein [Serratia fonticola]CAI1523037.1 Uncharacterised protein [Serratia fonticola]CAI1790645.1 Uncharacterised protein [Serratia fonticola]CAI1849400.1 Uncharacterised protein [Serratia fonticola]